MTYLKTRWFHDHSSDPIWIYEELDQERYETRKIEIFSDGSLGIADKTTPSGAQTELSYLPIPEISVVNSQKELKMQEISKEEFEEQWILAKS